MLAALKRLLGLDVEDMRNWIPDSDEFSIQLQTVAGPEGFPGEESLRTWTTSMHSSDSLRCRVCGWILPEAPWGVDGRSPLFGFCPCCGVEFGYQDASPMGARKFRQQWVDRGSPWEEPNERPACWSLERQMAGIPTDFR